MISVLIPIYNVRVGHLVSLLSVQLEASGIIYEIICRDDCSKPDIVEANSTVASFPNTSYRISDQNNGIAMTRQKLCQEASYDWCLLIDADVELLDQSFVQNYIRATETDADFVFGGFAYSQTQPDPDRLLRWKYGRRYEAKVAAIRNANPYKITIAANVLFKRQAYLKLDLAAMGNRYAMDYYFGGLLKANNSQVVHIDNNVMHLGLESNRNYVEKKERAVETLLMLHESQMIETHSNDLLSTFIKIRKLRATGFFAWLYRVFKQPLRHNLAGNRPFVLNLQIYKILYMCHTSRQK